MRRRLNVFLLLALLSATVGCDRVTKHIAMTSLAGAPDRAWLGGLVRLQYAENAGGFLSIGSGLSDAARLVVFGAGTALILIVLVLVAIEHHRSQWQTAAMTLLFAGGISNLLDRFMHGAVIDFVSIGAGGLRTGIFNVADVAVVAGICMLLADHLHSAPHPGELNDADEP